MGILTPIAGHTKYGLREVCDLRFEKVSGTGPDVFQIETAKMTTLETAATSVYAQGGQGNARYMAWDGEKTVTFTVEDALVTREAFQALTGAEVNNNKYKIKPTSFAGIYSIKAYTFMRDEEGNDHLTEIIIPKAKLQTTLNLSMAPSGDPSTFTFTFDALAGKLASETGDDYLFTYEIYTEEYNETTDKPNFEDASKYTYVNIEGEIKTKTLSSTDTTTKSYVLAIGTATGETNPASTITFGDEVFTATLPANKYLTNGQIMIGAGDAIDIKVGTSTYWEIV